MRKVYYIYNPQTQTYDRIYPTVRQRALSILRRLFYGMGLGAGCFIVLLLIFGSPSEKELRIENSRLLAQYNVLSRRLDDAMGVLQDIQQRDDNLYRVILQADPVSPAIRQAGYGGTNRYEELMDLANAKLVVNTTQKLDVLSKRLYIQSKSFDDVIDTCTITGCCLTKIFIRNRLYGRNTFQHLIMVLTHINHIIERYLSMM